MDDQLEQAPTTPGMKYRHYSPDAPVILIEPSGSGTGGRTDNDRVEAVHRRALEEVRSILRGRFEEASALTAIQSSTVQLSAPFRVALLLTTAPPGAPLGLWVDCGGSRGDGGGSGSRCDVDQATADYLLEGASLAVAASDEAAVSAVQSWPVLHSTPLSVTRGLRTVLDAKETVEVVEVVQYVLGCRGRLNSGADPGSGGSDGSGSGSVARGLFAALRLADEMRVSAVVVEGVADRDEGAAVMNRLRKAASRVVQV